MAMKKEANNHVASLIAASEQLAAIEASRASLWPPPPWAQSVHIWHCVVLPLEQLGARCAQCVLTAALHCSPFVVQTLATRLVFIGCVMLQ